MKNILGISVPLHIYTDSKSLFDEITKCSHTAEKWLMIDIKAVRNAFKAHAITNIAFVRSENNPADSFTKLTASSALKKVLTTNHCNFPVEKLLHCQFQDEFRDKKSGEC